MAWRLWIFCGVYLFTGGNSANLTIQECQQRRLDVAEDKSVTFTCGTSWGDLVWDVYNGTNHSVFSGSCNTSGRCTAPRNKFSLQRLGSTQNGYSAVLTITGVTRFSARTVTCRVGWRNSEVNCSLRITEPAMLVTGSCSLRNFQWHVLGNCTFKRMFDSDNNYTCVWRRNEDEILTEVQNRKWYQTRSSPYRWYVNGTCLYNQSIPIKTGTYRYSVRTSTGPLYVFPTNISIMIPGQPEHNCTEIVPEGSNITCTCRSSVIGDPPATVAWDGLNSQTLFIQNVRRENNSLVYTCRLTWGPNDVINRSVSYVIRVSYWPSDINTESTTQGKEKDKEKETDIFRLVNISTELPNSYSACSPIMTASSEVHNAVSTGSVSGGLIGGVLAAVIIIIIIIAVITICIIKRRKVTGRSTVLESSSMIEGVLGNERDMGYHSDAHQLFQRNSPVEETYAVVNKPRTQPPIARDAFPSGDLYTIASTTTARRGSDKSTAVCQMVDNEVYRADGNDDLEVINVAQQTEHPTKRVIPPVMPKTTEASVKTFPNVSGSCYVNVTEVPTDSGLGVYHIVPWAATCVETPPPASRDTAPPLISEDEYSVLQLENDRRPQDDQTDNYHHLQLQ